MNNQNKALKDLVVVAKFKRTHGVRGHIRIHPYTEVAEAVLQYPLWIAIDKTEAKTLKIESSRSGNNELIVKLADIDNPEQAALLTNKLIYTSRDAMPQTSADDEVYWVDLLGCQAYFAEQQLGTIVDIMDTGSNEVLVIEDNKKQYLVPYTNNAVGKVDIDNKSIELLWHPEDML